MGGYNPGMIKGDTYLEDVWSSEDGVTWTEATDSNVHFHFAQRVNYTFWRRDPGNLIQSKSLSKAIAIKPHKYLFINIAFDNILVIIFVIFK